MRLHQIDWSLLQQAIADRLGPILDAPGGLVYSAASTLQAGPLYILGLNPGGVPNSSSPRIRDSIAQIATQVGNDYFDAWAHYSPGRAPLQRRIRFVVEDVLGQSLTETFATNLVFRKTRSAAELALRTEGDQCWPVHELFIHIVSPKVILAFGNSGVSPYRYLLDKATSSKMLLEPEVAAPSGHGNWRLRSFLTTLAGRPVRVIGLPHLSRYDPTGKASVADWLKAVAGISA